MRAEEDPAPSIDAEESLPAEQPADAEPAAEIEADVEDTKKAKSTEGSAVLHMQAKAVEKLKALQTRHFTQTQLPIVTVGGAKLWVRGWSSATGPLNKAEHREREKTPKVCNICSREFLDNRRLAIHKNVHTKEENDV
ncbi:hypothetical protein NECID01_1132 [Nematocida sp. AWRm77]|nr:hypothetical protein NECID01_1132 [Nematocida sp. AWRm77]